MATPVSRFVREELPEGILLAGSPRSLDSIMIQARRSVLSPYKLAHPWFTTYYDEIRERTRATLRAHFADGPGPINELHRRWGATHFIVQKRIFEVLMRGLPVYAEPYNEEIYDELGPRRHFYLRPPPGRLVIWEDEHFAVIELPIPVSPTVPD